MRLRLRSGVVGTAAVRAVDVNIRTLPGGRVPHPAFLPRRRTLDGLPTENKQNFEVTDHIVPTFADDLHYPSPARFPTVARAQEPTEPGPQGPGSVVLPVQRINAPGSGRNRPPPGRRATA
ncbi:hypothetical protein GCM10011354_27400 [Egicoccus halophilus]|uniref:Uncharacterized protein n=1 Tax=Egicoccus halophilus TaxID=1670830 RepID=A0A8J3AA07_9ACTN|nr:hypothetical protein GCM10011354_27400 [Egicoccus halophilus]